MGIFELTSIVVLIMSVVLHELAHGYAANALGDPTARLAGRLTVNPVPHIDPVGSLLVPGILFITGAGFLFGWAKPVPYNPYNLNNQRWGEPFVAAAGPLTNLLLAFIFGMLVRFSAELGLSAAFIEIAHFVVLINVLLALFNSLPIPPLDGSKIIMPFLPLTLRYKYQSLAVAIDRMGIFAFFLIIFVFLSVLSAPFFAIVTWLTRLFLGF